MHSIVANLNLDQDVANKRERKIIAAHIVANMLSPITSCRNASLRFPYYHKPLFYVCGSRKLLFGKWENSNVSFKFLFLLLPTLGKIFK